MEPFEFSVPETQCTVEQKRRDLSRAAAIDKLLDLRRQQYPVSAGESTVGRSAMSLVSQVASVQRRRWSIRGVETFPARPRQPVQATGTAGRLRRREHPSVKQGR